MRLSVQTKIKYYLEELQRQEGDLNKVKENQKQIEN